MRLFLLLAAGFVFSTTYAQKDSVIRLNASSFEKRIQDENIQIVDVRTEQEFRSGHIKNALLMNWNDEAQFNDRIKYLEKDKPVYVYCLAGSRSLAAANWMKKNGFADVNELEGGINSWKKANLPVEGSSVEEVISYTEFLSSIPVDETTLVNIGSPGCPPCKKMEPVLENLKSNAKLHFKLINIDAGIQTDIVRGLNIDPLPVFIVYKKRKETWRKQGIISGDELAAKLQ